MKYLVTFFMMCSAAMASDLGTGANQAYPGDAGASVSNTAAAALPKTFTNAAAVTTMKITGGTPAVGAVWTCTNVNGSGELIHASTKMVLVTSQTTNTSTLTVTGAGFTPRGCSIDAVVRQIDVASWGCVGTDGSQYCVYKEEAGGYIRNANAAYLVLSGGSLTTSWTEWTTDGATFSRTKTSSPADKAVYYLFHFYR